MNIEKEIRNRVEAKANQHVWRPVSSNVFCSVSDSISNNIWKSAWSFVDDSIRRSIGGTIAAVISEYEY